MAIPQQRAFCQHAGSLFLFSFSLHSIAFGFPSTLALRGDKSNPEQKEKGTKKTFGGKEGEKEKKRGDSKAQAAAK